MKHRTENKKQVNCGSFIVHGERTKTISAIHDPQSTINEMRDSKGFSLIELLTVISIIGILATVLVVAVNPVRQFAKARDTQRETDLIAIMSALYQYSSEHSGALPDTDGNPNTSNFPTTLTCIGTTSPCFNLGAAGVTGDTIVPEYMPSIPKDPRTGTPANTVYLIMVDDNDRLVASASGETKTITVTR